MDAVLADLIKFIPQLGFGGLIFYMWYREKQDASKAKDQMDQMLNTIITSNKREDQLMQVVKENTIAITTLTERLTKHDLIEN